MEEFCLNKCGEKKNLGLSGVWSRSAGLHNCGQIRVFTVFIKSKEIAKLTLWLCVGKRCECVQIKTTRF